MDNPISYKSDLQTLQRDVLCPPPPLGVSVTLATDSCTYTISVRLLQAC